MPVTPADLAIADAAAECYGDPLKFVLRFYPWGEPGPLQAHDGPDTWQREWLQWWGEAIRARNFDGAAPVAPVRSAVSSGHGIGKALSNRTIVDTPTGRREWGTLAVGDEVFARDGSSTTVTGVYPQGERPIFRVTFDDGASVEADGDHLWVVRGRQDRRKGGDGWREMTTAQIIAAGVTRPNGSSVARQWEIPAHGPAAFPSQPCPIHPYTLGIWLGDGGRSRNTITSADADVIDQLRTVGEIVNRGVGSYAWNVQGLARKLKALGIGASYSFEKSVPRAYMENDAETRADVLRGLLDTDGECSKQGSVVFSSTSRQLVDDVVWLARSLGGKAQVHPTVHAPRYPGPDGEKRDGRPCWRATLTMPTGFLCFYVRRKQERVPIVQPRYRTRWISSIEPIGELPAQCITVAHPSKCFLANDFVVTHNSVIVAWAVDFIMSTRPHAQGTVTANTFTQLQTKTWAAIQRWTKLCLTGHWFAVTNERMYHPAWPESWFCALQSCKEENSEAFAGQHAADSTSFYIFDEASAIPDAIYEVAEGGLTDGEPMILIFGNPTRNSGRFHEACFGRGRDRWHPTIVDSRTSRFTNKDQIAEWATDYGEDSDFFRVRVRGLPPSASDVQFIGSGLVSSAQRRQVHVLVDEPLVCGLDLARGGGDDCVFRFRRGADARAIPPVRVRGEDSRDSSRLVSLAADILTKDYGGRRVSAMFVDATGGSIGGPIADRLRQLGHSQVFDVQFGGASPDAKCANMRAYMWSRMRDWLASGAIDQSADLEIDLTGPGFGHDKQDRILLESKEAMKKRGMDSPDDGDALALTFARPVGMRADTVARVRPYPVSAWS